jgi:hypothetical protein
LFVACSRPQGGEGAERKKRNAGYVIIIKETRDS